MNLEGIVMALDEPRDKLSSFGIIGGMGPASTIRFVEHLVAMFRDRRGAIRNSDFPRMVMCTLPNADHMTPSADLSIMSGLEASFTLFEQADVEFIVAPCNTVHQFLRSMEGRRYSTVLSIVESVWTTRGPYLEQKRVLMLSTAQTKTSGIYDDLFSRAKAEVTFVREVDQTILDNIITSINAGSHLSEATDELAELIAHYDYDVILLACTELSLLMPVGFGTSRGVIVDSLEALVEATFLASTERQFVRTEGSLERSRL